MKHIDLTPKPKNPVLEEKVICCLQDNIADQCGWINHVFNKAQRLNTKENARGFYPAILMPDKKDEYLPLFPNEELGNFAFFYCDDAQTIERNVRQTKIKAPFSCIVWGDTRSVNASRTELKESILRAFNLPVKVGSVELKNIYEKSENIYRNFSISEIDSQYLMEPFFGFRIDGILTFYVGCYE